MFGIFEALFGYISFLVKLIQITVKTQHYAMKIKKSTFQNEEYFETKGGWYGFSNFPQTQ